MCDDELYGCNKICYLEEKSFVLKMFGGGGGLTCRLKVIHTIQWMIFIFNNLIVVLNSIDDDNIHMFKLLPMS